MSRASVDMKPRLAAGRLDFGEEIELWKLSD